MSETAISTWSNACPYCTYNSHSNASDADAQHRLEDHIEWSHSNALQKPETD